MKVLAILGCSSAIAAFSMIEPAHAYDVVRVTDGGSVSGRVLYEGPVPEREELVVDTDLEACANEPKYSKALIVASDKAIKNVVVNLRNIERGKDWTDRHYTLGQHDCEFVPHVLLMVEGADLHIENTDRIAHSVRSHAADSVFNVGQPRFVEKLLVPNFTGRVSEHRIITLGCDIHKWMRGYVVVQDSPYYSLTGEDGRFELTDIPAGDYELEIWHETLGEHRRKVAVKPKATTELTIKLQPPPQPE